MLSKVSVLNGYGDRLIVMTALGVLALVTWCISLLLPGTAFDGILSPIVLFPLHLAGIDGRLSEIWVILGRPYWPQDLVFHLITIALVLFVLRCCRVLSLLLVDSTRVKLLTLAFISLTTLILFDFFASTADPYPFGAQMQYLLLLTFALVFAVKANTYWWRILLIILMGSMVLQSAYAVFLYATGTHTFTSASVAISRATGTLPGHNPNHLYPLCLMGALLLIPLATVERRLFFRLIYWLSLAVLTAAMLLTFSRAAGLGFAVGMTWFACEGRKSKRFWILVALAVSIMASMFIVRAIDGSGGMGVDRAAFGRIEIWRVSTKVIRSNWLLGTGYGGYGDAQKQHMDSRLAAFNPMNIEAKNQALNMLACHGIPGAAVFLLFIYAAWAGCRGGRKEDYTPWEWNMRQGVKLAGIGILFAGLVDTPLYSFGRYPGTFVWFVFMGFLLHLELKRHPPSEEWRHAKAFRRISLATGGLAVFVAVTLLTVGLIDASGASGSFQRTREAVRAKPSFAPLDQIPQAMQDCILANEDFLFHEHKGYRLVDMHRALRVNIRAGRVKQGGSTITQQLAKNLFFSHDRTIRRKTAEFIMAMRLEKRLTKEEILELYLNSIEYGLGSNGIGEAAAIYFEKDTMGLTDAECALLAGLVSRPPKDELTLERAKSALGLSLDRLAKVNYTRRSSVTKEINSVGEEQWLLLRFPTMADHVP